MKFQIWGGQQVDYLVFTEDIVLPFGWTSTITERGILIKNQMGQEMYLYENPHSTDAQNMGLREENTVFAIQHIGNTLKIATKVKADWLLSNERVYPVMVDPTVNVYPNNATNWTRTAGDNGKNYNSDLRIGMDVSCSDWLSGHIKFNATSIAASNTVTAVTGYMYIYEAYQAWGGTYIFTNSADPTTNSGSALHNSITDGYSPLYTFSSPNNSWKSGAFDSDGINYIQSIVGGNALIGIYPLQQGGYTACGQYYRARPHSHTNKPYLAITYTAPATPPSCATLIRPANGATAQAHQQRLAWNAVAGATGYDVYFGPSTGSMTMVSSNQSGTTYDIDDCLLPLQDYYWRVVPRNSNGAASGCDNWKFTTDNKIHIYENDFENANVGFFGTSGASVDGWYTNNNAGTGGTVTSGFNNTWTVGDGPHAINGKSIGVTALRNGGLEADHFMYWEDLGEIHRWVYRPFDMTGIRDIEVNFNWKCGGEANQDFGTVISSINGGANWLAHDQGGLNNDGRYWDSPTTVRNETVHFYENRNNQSQFVLGFRWDDMSGNGSSSYPSFVVDDIVLKGCPGEGFIGSDKVSSGVFEWTPEASTQTTLTVNETMLCAQYQWEKSTDEGATWAVISGATDSTFTTPSDLTETTWYRAKVYFSTGCTGVYQDDEFKIIIEKDCIETTTYANGIWSNGYPTDSPKKLVVIENDFTVNSEDIIACSLEVRNGAKLTVTDGYNLFVDEKVVVDNTSNSQLTIKDGANLFQVNDAAINIGKIKVEKQFVFSEERKQYNFVSVPVKDFLLKGGVSNDALYDGMTYVLKYNEATDYFVNASNADHITGKGFAIKEASVGKAIDGLGVFIGVPNNGVASIDLVKTGQGFNLIGNPYPSTLDLKEFYYSNASALDDLKGATFYFWDNRENGLHEQWGPNYVNYDTHHYGHINVIHPGGTGVSAPHAVGDPKVPTQYIKPGTGFLVHAKGNHAVTFNNAQRKLGESPSYTGKTTQANQEIDGANDGFGRYWLEMKTPGQIVLSTAIAYFEGGDNNYGIDDSDAYGSSDELYFTLADKKLIIQGKEPFVDTDVVPMGYKAFDRGTYSIELGNIEGVFATGQKIYLKDKQMNVTYDLSQGAYQFKSNAGEFNNRFEIVYKKGNKASGDVLHRNEIAVQKNNHQIEVTSTLDKIVEVEIYNLSGRSVIKARKINDHIWSVPAARYDKQILFVVVKTETGEIVTKKLVNK